MSDLVTFFPDERQGDLFAPVADTDKVRLSWREVCGTRQYKEVQAWAVEGAKDVITAQCALNVLRSMVNAVEHRGKYLKEAYEAARRINLICRNMPEPRNHVAVKRSSVWGKVIPILEEHAPRHGRYAPNFELRLNSLKEWLLQNGGKILEKNEKSGLGG